MTKKDYLLILIAFIITLVILYAIRGDEPVIYNNRGNTAGVIAAVYKTLDDTEPKEEANVIDVNNTPVKAYKGEIDDLNALYDVPLSDDVQVEIMDVCDRYGVDVELVLAIISVESNFNPEAVGDHGRSFGLMQIQPRWWTNLLKENGVDNLLDPVQNVAGGCAILTYLADRYNTNITETLALYNSGSKTNAKGLKYARRVLDKKSRLVKKE